LKRQPKRIGEARGFVYEPVDEELLQALVASMEECRLPESLGAEPLFDHGVRSGYRLANQVVKYYRGGKWRDRWRQSPAVRACEAYERLLPIRSPKPSCAFEIRRGRDLHRSVMMIEFVEGPLLGEAWGKVPEAMDALGPFLARMHDRWIYHGVMKWDHLIWNRGEWVVLDLESLRHPLRKLHPRRLAERQWAALAMDLGVSDDLERAFRSYLSARGVDWDADETWRSIVRRSEATIAAGTGKR
jgi:hypothetical protein